MTNEELQAVLAEALKPVQESLTAVNQKLTDIEAENVKLKEQLQANTEQEETAMRAAIIAELKLPESAVNALKGEALRETYALTSKPAALKGGFQPNHADDDFDVPTEYRIAFCRYLSFLAGNLGKALLQVIVAFVSNRAHVYECR